MITIDPYNRAPIYEQVFRRISELIMVGDLKNGDKLPSVRSLARDLGVNPNTVQKAYAELERNRIIYSVTGKGNFVGEQEAASRQMGMQLLGNIREAVQSAYNNRIPLEDIYDIIHEIYGSQQDGKDEEGGSL